MKINKLLTSIAVIAPVAGAIPFVTTSCNKQTESMSEAEEYIKDRSFGISAVETGVGRWMGTAWVLSDATPNVLDDYNYYIATNWHVKLGLDHGTTISYHFDGMGNNVYSNFASFEWKPQTDFCFGSSTADAIDFYICKVDFGSSSSIPNVAKTKLDKLNTYQKEHKHINKFAKSSSTSNFTNTNMYIGGYPLRSLSSTTSGQKWCFETVNTDTSLFSKKGGTFNDHYVNDEKTIIDTSANYVSRHYYKYQYDYVLQKWIPISWTLSGGASGSMAIARQNNEWVVVGIYWGGWDVTDEYGEEYFAPAWSIFKSDDKNFVADYE